MVLEVEGKYRVDCRILGEMGERLSSIGASFQGEFDEVDVYYAHPCRDLKITDEVLRVRYSGGSKTLTYKSRRRGRFAKEREEVEVSVVGDIEELLGRVGFREAVTVRKKRSYYRVGGMAVVSLDRVDGLGCFVEIESLEGGEETIERIAEALGLAGASMIRESYVEMLYGSL